MCDVPTFRDEPSVHRYANAEFEVIERHAHADEVFGAMGTISEREACLRDARIEIIEESDTKEMLVELWETSHRIVAIVPEPHE